MPQEEERIRTIAGYLLKNNARLILRSSPEVSTFVKASVLQAFSETSIMVRNTAGQDIVAFLGILEPRNWPECLQHLVQALDSQNVDQQEVSALHRYGLLLPLNPSFIGGVQCAREGLRGLSAENGHGNRRYTSTGLHGSQISYTL